MMSDGSTEHLLQTAKRLLGEKYRRVERQRQLVIELEAGDHSEKVLRDARELLRQMIANLNRMLENFHRIERQGGSAEESPAASAGHAKDVNNSPS